MNIKLRHIQNWPERAQAANWSADKLAKDCGISLRTLQRYFLKKMGKSPKKWLLEQQLQQAIKLFQEGSSIKETAGHLGYKSQHHFARQFKRQTGYPPGQLLNQPPVEVKTTECRV